MSAVNRIVDKIESLPNGAEFTIGEIIKELKLQGIKEDELFDLTFKVFDKIAESTHVALCNETEDEAAGLPYNILYTVARIDGKKSTAV